MKKFVILIILISFLLVTSCISKSDHSSKIDEGQVVSELEMSTFVMESTETAAFSNQTPSMTPTLHLTHTQTATPSASPTPTITPSPPELGFFVFSDLHPMVEPVSYIEDPCAYLLNRWGENKSVPGTIVVPIMFHSVVKPGREVTDDTSISQEYLDFFMEKAMQLGFDTITTEELIGFLETNEKIPERSMILILDDRRPGVTEDYFMPYLIENDWTLTLAWPTTDTTGNSLWERMEALAETGYLDIQSHGHDHIYIQGYTPLEEIEEEIFKPVEVIQSHFGTTPRAIIWPGGNFNEIAIQMAKDAGFKVGFTVFSRGPVMYNWIPLGPPETAMDAPFYLLPRFWSTAADVALDKSILIAEEAQLAAEAQKDDELRYIDLYCQQPDGD